MQKLLVGLQHRNMSMHGHSYSVETARGMLGSSCILALLVMPEQYPEGPAMISRVLCGELPPKMAEPPFALPSLHQGCIPLYRSQV